MLKTYLRYYKKKRPCPNLKLIILLNNMSETKDECARALALLTSLERHTLNGRHMCANNVVIDLLFNMRITLERLNVKLQARETHYSEDIKPRFTGKFMFFIVFCIGSIYLSSIYLFNH